MKTMRVNVVLRYVGVDCNSEKAGDILEDIGAECKLLGDTFNANQCWIDEVTQETEEQSVADNFNGVENYLSVVPAFGRDYKTAKEALMAWKSGKDFRISASSSEFCGSYCSIRDSKTISATGWTGVLIYFNGFRNMVHVRFE